MSAPNPMVGRNLENRSGPFMPLPITPVASGARHAVLDTGGFALTEACYGAGHTLPSHAHQRPVLTFILHGSVREQRGAGFETCRSLGLVAIPAGEPHAESFPAPGSRCLIIEVSDERAEFIRSFSTILDQPSIRHDPPVAGLGPSDLPGVSSTRRCGSARHRGTPAPVVGADITACSPPSPAGGASLAPPGEGQDTCRFSRAPPNG